MKRYKAVLSFLFIVTVLDVWAQDYPASLFGIRPDGLTLNTRSIQYAIDYINVHGGGRLVFSVGRYLTGSIHLKSNVSLELQDGSVLAGSLNPLDYEREIFTALIFAYNEQNIAIAGKGTIDGQGSAVAANLVALIHAGIIKDALRNDRPLESIRPMLIYFRSCNHVVVKEVTLKNAASWVQTYDQCKNVLLDSITVDSRSYWNNDGTDIVDCDTVRVTHCRIDAADDGICLKSHDATKICQHILIDHNAVRSSASGIKLGTASVGGFSHITIIHDQVIDTYRSAIALEAVDGGSIDHVEVDSVTAIHTGNAIFLRVGERVAGKKSRLEDIHISNIYADIAAGKPDSGYSYEGPTEDQPRNISPAIIMTGLSGSLISGVTMDNIKIFFPGGGNPFVANVPVTQLNKIEEKASSYPEFSMFKELPAWGVFIRHAKDISINGLELSCSKKDYRVAIVGDDVHQVKMISTTVKGTSDKRKFYFNNSTEINTR